MKQWHKGVVLALCGALVTLGATGCCALFESSSSSSDESGTSTNDTSHAGGAPTLEEFLDADSKTGTYTITSHYASDDSELTQEAEFWVDGRLFRYDLYQDGEPIRSILTPDGETAYFAQYDSQICEPSVASVDHYMRMYSEPPADAVEDGIDGETGAARIKYVLQITEDMPGSSNAWYSEDITYLVQDDIIIGFITRGTVPEDDGTIGDLNESRVIFGEVSAGVSIPEGTFDLPYPIQEAQ